MIITSKSNAIGTSGVKRENHYPRDLAQISAVNGYNARATETEHPRAVTKDPYLRGYYHEAWDVKIDPALGSGDERLSPAEKLLSRHIAVMQVELMIRAFSSLQLQRFGNAPGTRGG